MCDTYKEHDMLDAKVHPVFLFGLGSSEKNNEKCARRP